MNIGRDEWHVSKYCSWNDNVQTRIYKYYDRCKYLPKCGLRRHTEKREATIACLDEYPVFTGYIMAPGDYLSYTRLLKVNIFHCNQKIENGALSPIHSVVFAWKIYAARRDCHLIDFNSFLSFNGCLMTIKFEDRYYILVHKYILIYGDFSSSNIR